MTGLVEREAALATLRERLASVVTHGHIALVAGEAGIGKTSVLRALAREHAAHAPVWWGACDALQTPHPLAPLLDMARESSTRFAARLDGPRPALFEAVLEELRSTPRPVLVVVEDAHWADDATLDLLKFLGRRIERMRALLAISFRDDEVTASHPLRRVLGELPTSALTRVELPRLSPQAVEAMAKLASRPSQGVHAVTRGNPFFVTEVLREHGAAVPSTVRDLVLARLARLPAPAQELLRLVSLMPGHAERWLVDALLAPSLHDFDACLGSGLLVADATTLTFRHELGRVAVESSLSPPAAQALHARVLSVLAAEGRQTAPARLVHHALRAQDQAAVSRFAPTAAAEARVRGAHRESAAQWRIALRQGVPGNDAEHRRWLEDYAIECSIVGLLDEELEAILQLERMARERGDLEDTAVQLSRRTSAFIAQLRHPEANAASRDAIAILDKLPPSAAHVRVWSSESWMRMLERDYEESVQWGRRAIELGEALGERVFTLRARGAMATSLLFIDYERAVAELGQVRELYDAAGNLQSAALTLSNLGSGSGELMRLPEAEVYLREAIALCIPNEFDRTFNYCTAWLALCVMLRGRWDEAASIAAGVLGRSGPDDMSRLMATLAVARLRMRRGDPGADQVLEHALKLAGPSSTLQRIAPTRAARAEAAFGRGDLSAVVAETAQAMPLANAKRHPWFIGELAYWSWRAGAISAAPPGCAKPYALEIAGRWREAADAWQLLDCPFERARALAEGDADSQQEALAVFDALGARPAADALRRRLREAGVRGVARGARASTREHPCGLTGAEMKVLALMSEDLKNAEIASRLHRSVRTVDHHVAAVLAKLGVATRQGAVRRAQREGWLPQIGQSPGAN